MPSADTQIKCECKQVPCTPHRRLGFVVLRFPRAICNVHFPKPLPWDHPDSDPIGDINRALSALTPRRVGDHRTVEVQPDN